MSCTAISDIVGNDVSNETCDLCYRSNCRGYRRKRLLIVAQQTTSAGLIAVSRDVFTRLPCGAAYAEFWGALNFSNNRTLPPARQSLSRTLRSNFEMVTSGFREYDVDTSIELQRTPQNMCSKPLPTLWMVFNCRRYDTTYPAKKVVVCKGWRL